MKRKLGKKVLNYTSLIQTNRNQIQLENELTTTTLQNYGAEINFAPLYAIIYQAANSFHPKYDVATDVH